MIKIQLNRSGGQLGKTLQSTREVDMAESQIIETLQEVAPEKNPLARDSFHYSITINDNQTLPIDITRLKGELKKLVNELDKSLKLPER